jgi:methionyl-tRNA synthetase
VSDEEFLTAAQVIPASEWAAASAASVSSPSSDGGATGSGAGGASQDSTVTAAAATAATAVAASDTAVAAAGSTSAGEDSEGMVSAATGHPVIEMREENYMFRLSSFAEPLRKWLNETTPSPVQPPNRQSAVENLLSSGLDDLSVSRHRRKQPWGIEVPGDSDHTVYVWLDALVNYLTVESIG